MGTIVVMTDSITSEYLYIIVGVSRLISSCGGDQWGLLLAGKFWLALMWKHWYFGYILRYKNIKFGFFYHELLIISKYISVFLYYIMIYYF